LFKTGKKVEHLVVIELPVSRKQADEEKVALHQLLSRHVRHEVRSQFSEVAEHREPLRSGKRGFAPVPIGQPIRYNPGDSLLDKEKGLLPDKEAAGRMALRRAIAIVERDEIQGEAAAAAIENAEIEVHEKAAPSAAQDVGCHCSDTVPTPLRV
jgi:hypothetical protein